jgi:hypothetical protein
MLSSPSVEFDISDLLRNGFDESVARELYACGEEVVVWVMLQRNCLFYHQSVFSSFLYQLHLV